MHCANVRKQLSAYLDGELPVQLRVEIAAHLQHCQACLADLAKPRQLGDLIGAVSFAKVPEGFAGRVISEARRRIVSPPRAERASFQLIRRWRSIPLTQRAAAAAVLIIGLSTGLFMGWQTGSNHSAQALTLAPHVEDPVAVYNLDFLGTGPNGSLPRVYLSLVSAPNGLGE